MAAHRAVVHGRADPAGFLNGYVQIPEDHPLYRRPRAELELDFPEQLTYADDYPAEQLENGDGVPPGWWIGFDHAHGWDIPDPDRWAQVSGGMPWPGGYNGHRYTAEEVALEVEELARLVRGMDTGR